jgi:hypothetical protein
MMLDTPTLQLVFYATAGVSAAVGLVLKNYLLLVAAVGLVAIVFIYQRTTCSAPDPVGLQQQQQQQPMPAPTRELAPAPDNFAPQPSFPMLPVTQERYPTVDLHANMFEPLTVQAARNMRTRGMQLPEPVGARERLLKYALGKIPMRATHSLQPIHP